MTNCTISTLKSVDNELAVTMQAKEALVWAHVFPKVLASQGSKYQPG